MSKHFAMCIISPPKNCPSPMSRDYFFHSLCCGRNITRHVREVSTVRLLKTAKIYFQNVSFLSDSPCLKILFDIVCTIVEAFIITGHQFLCFLLVGCVSLWPQTAGRFASCYARYHDRRWTFQPISSPFHHSWHFHRILHISDVEYQPVSHFWHSRKRITDRISQSAGRSIILNILNAQNNT
jgi:hypothetical protein